MVDRGLLGLAAGVGIGAAVCYYFVSKERASSHTRARRSSTNAASVDKSGPLTAVAKLAGKAIVPPLPSVVIELLRSTSLCFLATSAVDQSDEDKAEPHLSLMRFTHSAAVDDSGDDVVILSTRRDTKKFAMLTANPLVAILVHDFDSRKSELAGATGGKYTITLNGEARVETTHAEAYRQVHAQNNPGYEQFICGDGIAVVTVRVTVARVCDVNDRVRFWSREKSKPGEFESA